MGADAHVAQGSSAIASRRWANPPLSDCWLAPPRQTSTRRAFRITAASMPSWSGRVWHAGPA